MTSLPPLPGLSQLSHGQKDVLIIALYAHVQAQAEHPQPFAGEIARHLHPPPGSRIGMREGCPYPRPDRLAIVGDKLRQAPRLFFWRYSQRPERPPGRYRTPPQG